MATTPISEPATNLRPMQLSPEQFGELMNVLRDHRLSKTQALFTEAGQDNVTITFTDGSELPLPEWMKDVRVTFDPVTKEPNDPRLATLLKLLDIARSYSPAGYRTSAPAPPKPTNTLLSR
jgi:hypothetical protein